MAGNTLMGQNAEGPLNGRYDRVAAVLGLFVAVAMFPLRFFMSHIYASTFPIVLALAAGLYLLSTYSDENAGYALPTVPSWGAYLLSSLGFFGVAGLVLVAAFAGERSIAFYNLAGVVGSVVLAQVFFVDEDDLRPGLILAQVVALAATLRLAALFTRPGVIGVDTWSHTRYVEDVMAQHSLSAIQTKYVAAPLFHLLGAFTAMAADVSPRNGIYLSFGLAYPVILLLTYHVARLFAPTRWALLATLLYVINEHTIRWGITVIPTGMALAMFVAAAYLLTRLLKSEYNVRETLLVALLIVGITLTHQVSSFIMLVALGSVFLVEFVLWSDRLFPRASVTDVSGLVFFNAGFVILVWSVTPYVGGTFTSVMIERFTRTVSRSAGLFNTTNSAKNVAAAAGGAESTLATKLIAYVDVFSFLVMLCLAGIGALFVLRSRRASQARLGAVTGIGMMAAFALGFPVLGIPTFLPGRWFGFMLLLTAIVGALGVGYLAAKLHPRLFLVFVVALLLLYPTTTILTGAATRDNPVFREHQIRTGYSAQELAAVETVAATKGSERPVYTDSPYRSVFERRYQTEAQTLVYRQNGNLLRTNDVTIYRDYQSEGSPLYIVERSGMVLDRLSQERVCPPNRNRVYANGDVIVCNQPT